MSASEGRIDDGLRDLETFVNLKFQLQGTESSKGAAVDFHSTDIHLGNLGSNKHVSDQDAEAESELVKIQAYSHLSGTIKLVGPELNF